MESEELDEGDSYEMEGERKCVRGDKGRMREALAPSTCRVLLSFLPASSSCMLSSQEAPSAAAAPIGKGPPAAPPFGT